MTQRGFTLIEVLIASLIAAILGTVLLTTFYQTNRSTQSMSNLIDIHEKISLAVAQLERDLSGAFIPREEKKDKDAQKIPSDDEKKQKPLTHIFYSTNKDNQLDTLTFITNNPMQVYWSARAGGARPRIARVVYRLVPVQNKSKKNSAAPQSYVLMRQESSNLDFDAYKTDATQPIRAFEMIDGIKELKVSFGAEIEQISDATATKEQKATKPETKYQRFDDWNIEEKKEEEKEKRRKVPHDVEFVLTLWDAQKKYTTTVPFKIAIVPDLALKEEDSAAQKTVKIPQKTMINAFNGAQNAIAEYNKARMT